MDDVPRKRKRPAAHIGHTPGRAAASSNAPRGRNLPTVGGLAAAAAVAAGFVHFAVPYPPPGCSFVRVVAVSTGCGYMLRAVTIFEREQQALPGVNP